MEQAVVQQKLVGLRSASDERTRKFKKKAFTIALFRGVLFVAACLWMWLLFPSSSIIAYAFGFLLLFLWMMKRQADIRKKIAFETAFQTVISRDLDEDKPHEVRLPDELEQNPLARDLDVFGKFSLHASIHRTYSSASALKLGISLINYPQDSAVISGRQKAIIERSKKHEEVYHFFALSLLASFSDKEEKSLNDWLESAHFRVNLWLIRGFAFLFFLVALAGIMEWIPIQFVLYAFLVNLMMVYFRNKKIAALQVNLSKVHPSLEKLAAQIGLWQKELSGEQEKTGWSEPASALKRLSRIMARLDSRLNPMGAFLSNGILLYDLHTMHQLEQWRTKHAKQLPVWLDDLAEREVLTSKVAYFMRKGGVFPELSDASFELNVQGLIHPLMSTGKAVANSFKMDEKGRGVILTGSNMSGKSTFLRTLGSSLILAHNGLPLPCNSFTFTPLQLCTSVRVSDSLEEDASYFYAELKRLAEIMEQAATHPRVFFLLDEILRGTNSADKQAGSRAMLLQLIQKGANGILATHDLSLTELESDYPGQITNYAFESRIIANKLSFDYTLKKGVCSQLNAMFLMKTMGIME